LRHVTVATDYGCGIVRKVAPSISGRFHRLRHRAKFARWTGFGEDYAAAWHYFAAHQKPLLNLIDVEAFVAGRDGLG